MSDIRDDIEDTAREVSERIPVQHLGDAMDDAHDEAGGNGGPHPDAGEDPNTETPDGDDSDAPADHPSG